MFTFLHQYSMLGFWILEVVTGVIFIFHGVPKMKHPAGIAGTLHAPVFVGFLQGLVEVLGGIGLILAIYVPWISLVFAIIMLGAIYFKALVWKTGFWSHTGTGWEFDLLLLAVFIMILTK